jgi:hypothetical protein
MKLWIVITLMGKLASTIGPVPNGMDECLAKVAEKNREVDKTFADPATAADSRSWLDGHHLQRSDLAIACIYSDARPVKP